MHPIARGAAVIAGMVLTGCMPIYHTHAVDADTVYRVLLWDRGPGDAVGRVAVVDGEDARALVRCMRYDTQDNPFSTVIGACTCKPSAFGVILRSDGSGTAIDFGPGDGLGVAGRTGSVVPPFDALYARLPWQTAAPTTTRPAAAGQER